MQKSSNSSNSELDQLVSLVPGATHAQKSCHGANRYSYQIFGANGLIKDIDVSDNYFASHLEQAISALDWSQNFTARMGTK